MLENIKKRSGKKLKGKDCEKKEESGDFSYIRLYKTETMVSFLVQMLQEDLGGEMSDADKNRPGKLLCSCPPTFDMSGIYLDIGHKRPTIGQSLGHRCIMKQRNLCRNLARHHVNISVV
jgi:hypothetical protein